MGKWNYYSVIWDVRLLSIQEADRKPRKFQVPPWFIGAFERMLAYLVFFLSIPEAYTILGAWIVVKLASNWHRLSMDGVGEEDREGIVTQSLIALMAGTLSVAIGAWRCCAIPSRILELDGCLVLVSTMTFADENVVALTVRLRTPGERSYAAAQWRFLHCEV
jgi:hypothetical protein